MKTKTIGQTYLFFVALAVFIVACGEQVRQEKSGEDVQFKKTTLTPEFISEGVAVADVNNDGVMDIIAGAKWFEGPDWIPHDIYQESAIFSVDSGYSNSMLNFAVDVNQDGWMDYIRVDFPGKEIWWYENPQNQQGYWKQHVISEIQSNESPAFVDIDGDGRPDILCGDPNTNEMVWFRCPSEEGDTEWVRYVISEEGVPGTEIFSHGLGFGDINGDGRGDVIIKDGWWEGPADPTQPQWTFHEADLGENCAQMYVMDVNDDGYPDVVSSSAHGFGIWWHEQGRDSEGNVTWQTHEITNDFSQNHALSLVDINGDGNLDLLSGMRYFAHFGNDPGELNDPVIFWLEFVPGETPTWIPYIIDNDSGAGLNNEVVDVNDDGLLDIVVANKKGVFYFERVAR